MPSGRRDDDCLIVHSKLDRQNGHMCSQFMIGVILSIIFVPVENKINSNINQRCGNANLLGNSGCFFTKTNDVLPAVNEMDLKAHNNSIYFVVIPCSGGLTYKQACSVESAARAHPLRQIVIFFLGPVSRYCLNNWPISYLLKRYNNIKLYRLNVTEFLNETIMSDYFSSGLFDNSKHQMLHLSTILRLITLNKFGGVFLDLHLIVMKPLDEMVDNWFTKEEDAELSYEIMSLNKDRLGKTLSDSLLSYYKEKYNPTSWESFIAFVFHKILKRTCRPRKKKPKKGKKVNLRQCRELKIYGSKMFFPIKQKQYSLFFVKYDPLYSISWDSYAYYVWDNVAPSFPLPTDDTLYKRLMTMFCPYMYHSISGK